MVGTEKKASVDRGLCYGSVLPLMSPGADIKQISAAVWGDVKFWKQLFAPHYLIKQRLLQHSRPAAHFVSAWSRP